MSAQLRDLRSRFSTSQVFEQGQPEYHKQSEPWSKHAELNPKLVIQPTTLDGMQKAVHFLYDSDLDFAIRSTGTGSVSARDVILSTHGFKSFSFDKTVETVTVGAGLDWGEVDALMEDGAPGYAVVGARCPWVGVAGSSLVGGLSWLSHEFGMISDPQNLLDAQVVLRDGNVVWAAKEEPDLMFALRGGGGNFGVLTALTFRARPYVEKVFGGAIALPYSALRETAKGVAAMSIRTADPKVAMHVVNVGPGLGMPDQGSRPGIGIMMFDARGEAHARSKDGFAWAFEIPGAHEVSTSTCTLKQTHAVAETFRNYQGNNMFWLSAPLIEGDLDDEMLVRVWKWYEDSIEAHPGFGAGSTVLLEFMQENAFNSSSSRNSTAWPHSGHRHVLQLVLGCKPETAPANVQEIVMKRFHAAGREVAGDRETREFLPWFLNEWNDLRQVYGENYDRLMEIKKRFDPENRFHKGVDLMRARVSEGMTV
ncbi:hypothetical protein LTR91_007437 [Friedmanniomyces endolithicus]|uniref:FAD-binding PCMH-type domain-containing protein n=1 Tax=Friedmanniomyces endolithicus TaxID=329885 RepID=A0AAN6QVY1_9PEZI|nr:hypothetical protein LTR94_000307 [Friedmanniomyces endolithicus]KAK0814914.1 hypothetical protein LTR59_000669 [Friedmanniomyces endolithicus]KAK0820407.1 hypothetical protein LTR38_000316 [Friedmanniomyces endolithicus]KAK0884029.1 hypothetical protein LTR87_002250 [Friedmanniomyces endolithicus]KAK0913442.1 hypothetical protein LTR02_002290 [Friedmanniomyces endolithicus]